MSPAAAERVRPSHATPREHARRGNMRGNMLLTSPQSARADMFISSPLPPPQSRPFTKISTQFQTHSTCRSIQWPCTQNRQRCTDITQRPTELPPQQSFLPALQEAGRQLASRMQKGRKIWRGAWAGGLHRQQRQSHHPLFPNHPMHHHRGFECHKPRKTPIWSRLFQLQWWWGRGHTS